MEEGDESSVEPDLTKRARRALERTLQPVDLADDSPIDGAFLALMTAAIDAMPRRRRAIFLAVRRDGMSYRAISQATGLSITAVEDHIAKAIACLDHTVRYAEIPARPRWWQIWRG